jgi:hypothetical protein
MFAAVKISANSPSRLQRGGFAFLDQAADEHLRAICALDLIRSAYDLPMFDIHRHRKRLKRVRFRAEHLP